ncbi:hypothetical protein GCM10027419_31520 [Pandoraea terrae]
MTSFDEFFDLKRQERKRGKLAGMVDQILEFRASGASFTEIAEYLHLAHGISVTPRAVAKHVRSRTARQPAREPLEPHSPATLATTKLLTRTPAPGLPTTPAAQPHPIPPIAPQKNASAPGEAFWEQRPTEGDTIQTRAEAPAEDVVVPYRLSSPDYQAKLAAYRQRKNQSQT